jgi:hypothetical protein
MAKKHPAATEESIKGCRNTLHGQGNCPYCAFMAAQAAPAAG